MPSIAFGRSVLKTGSPGTAAAKAHYIAREQSYGPGERKVHYVDRTEQYRVRDDLVHAEPPRNLPHWAQDAATFFGVAATQERANGQVLIEYKLSLPRALDTGQQLALVRDFVEVHLPSNPTVWAMHEPQGLDDSPHPHVHILASPRERDSVERSASQFFRRYNADHPEKGGARKSPALNQWNAIGREKQLWSDLANVHLEKAGLDVRYHPASLHARGFPVGAEPKLLPSDSFAYHSRGVITETMQKLLDHRQKMVPHREAESVDAQQYWESRKQQLGLTPGMTHEQALSRIAAGRQHALEHPPPKRSTRERQAQVAQSQQYIRALDEHVGRIGDQQYLEAEHTHKGTQRSPASVGAVEQLLAVQPERLRPPREQEQSVSTRVREQAAAIRARTAALRSAGKVLAALEGEEHSQGAGLKVRLHREEERDRGGMSW